MVKICVFAIKANVKIEWSIKSGSAAGSGSKLQLAHNNIPNIIPKARHNRHTPQRDTASNHLHSLCIGQIFKVAPDPDRDPDQDYFWPNRAPLHVLLVVNDFLSKSDSIWEIWWKSHCVFAIKAHVKIEWSIKSGSATGSGSKLQQLLIATSQTLFPKQDIIGTRPKEIQHRTTYIHF